MNIEMADDTEVTTGQRGVSRPGRELLNLVKRNWPVLLLSALTPVCLFVVRFLPMYDYPHWVYQARVLQTFERHEEWFDLASVPVPNLGGTLGLLGLSPLLGAELGAKVLLAVYASTTVLAFAYVCRGVSRRPSAAELLGSLFVYNYFFYCGFLSYILGLPILLATFGLLVRLHRRNNRGLLLVALLSLVTYLCHLFAWLPIAAYVIVSFFWRPRKVWVALVLTQVTPVLLLGVYALQRQAEGSIRVSFFASVPDKLFSLVAPNAPFSRIDPFPPPFSTFGANLFFAMGVGVVLLWGILKQRRGPLTEAGHVLLYTSLSLLVAAALLPLNQLAGMGAVDQRLSFVACLGLVVVLGTAADRRLGPLSFALCLCVLVLHAIMFRSAGTELARAYKVMQRRPAGASAFVATLRHPPMYGECAPSGLRDFGNGVFPLQWFPVYDVVERGQIVADTFDTALLRPRPGARFAMRFGQYQTPAEREALIRDVGKLAASYEYLLLLGCPEEIESVSTIWQSGYTLVERGTNIALVRLG